MTILLKYPTRSRPALFRSTLGKYLGMLSGKHDVKVIISCDEDDATMTNPEMRAFIESQPVPCQVFYNPPPQTKITAVNANMDGVAWDVVILCSDDMIPQVQGYDDRIVQKLFAAFPDGDGLLHVNDGVNGRALNTHVIMGGKYYDRFGRLYADQYRGLWCDNELQAVSERLGKSAYVDEVLIRHEWIGRKETRDALLRRNESYFHQDAETFKRRKAAGFPN